MNEHEDGWTRAAQMIEALRNGHSLPVTPSSVVLAQGEDYHFMINMALSVYCSTDTEYSSSSMMFGSSWKGLAATAGASALWNSHKRNQARRESALQWRALGGSAAQLTSQRLLLLVNGEWVTYSLDGGILSFEPHFHQYAAVLAPNGGNLIAMEGPHVPYLAVALYTILYRRVPDLVAVEQGQHPGELPPGSG